MGFVQEREIVEITNQHDFEELTELEDLELHIKGAVSVAEDIEITDCNILFHAGGQMAVKGGTTALNDCEVIFPGDTGSPAILGAGGDLSFDTCDIHQLESSGKEQAAFIEFCADNKAAGKAVELSNCKIHDMNGLLIESKGANVYIEKSEIHHVSGTVANIRFGVALPSFVVSECAFKQCSERKWFVEAKKQQNEEHSGRLFGGSLFSVSQEEREEWDKKYEREKQNWLIKIGHVMSGKIENCHFEDCRIGCISADGSDDWRAVWDAGGTINGHCPFTINNCTFKNCDNRTSRYGKIVLIKYYKTTISNCRFHRCAGVETWTQFTELLIENCEFKECKTKGSMEGILNIGVEVEEKLMYIRNCKFEKCAVEKESRYDTGIIFLCSGVADKKRKKTVTIQKCSFQDCVGREIRGTERDEGFFGKSVLLYERES